MVKEREEEEASIARPSKPLILPLLLFFPLLCSSCCSAQGNLKMDKRALRAFQNVANSTFLATWNPKTSVCNWAYVNCSNPPERVTELHLSGILLYGPILPKTLGRLDALQTLSLSSNNLSGGLPSDFANLIALQQLNISFNILSGSIPDFLNNLTKLKSLDLQNNSFNGTIPALNIPSLETFNVSNNDLNGPIPGTLATKFPSSSFTGNVDLCGFPLQACSSPSHSKLSKWAIVGIACGAAAAVFLLLLLLMLCRKRKGGGRTAESSRWMDARSTASAGKEEEQLVFIEGKQLFNLNELLCASAEMLGKGTLGSSYKAALESSMIVVTKRLEHVDDSRRDEYLQCINGIASLKHDNLLPLRAYYFGKGGNLLIYDFMRNGSLSALLHGSREEKQKPLDWEARVRVAATSARGLAFLHAQDMVHGNLKSSNVLLMSNLEACLADYHMLAFMKSPIAYLAPEITDPHAIIPQADVFSFGVLLLELLTAKLPLLSSPSAPSASHSNDPIDLPRWVQSVAREEWTAKVFDPSLLQSVQPPNEEEMLHLLQLAMTCVAPSPDQRPSMVDVVQTIDKMYRTTDDDDKASDLDQE